MNLCISALIMALLLPPFQPRQETSVSTVKDDDIRDIERMFLNYNRALVEKNYDELTHLIHVPFVVVDRVPRIVSDVGVVIAGLRANRESYDQQAYATSVPDQAQVSVLDSDRVLLNRIIRHYRKDGSLLETRANFYMMSKVSGEWKISGIIPQDPVYTGRIYTDGQRDNTQGTAGAR